MKIRNRLIALAMTLVCMIATEGLFGQDKKGDPSKGNQEKANPAKKSRPEPPGPEEPKKESPKTGEKKDSGKPMPAKEPMPAKDDGKKPAPKTGNWYIRSSPQMMKTLEPIVRQSSGTTVKVLANVKSRSKEQEQQVSLGTVVDAGGLILTKASQIYAKAKTLKVEINGKKVPAKVFGVDEDSDLALLKIEPAGLEIKPIQWQNQTPRVGHFLATPDSESKTIGFGVLSVASREERNTRGFLYL